MSACKWAGKTVKKIRNVLCSSLLYLMMCCYESREHAMNRIAASVEWSVFLRCNSPVSPWRKWNAEASNHIGLHLIRFLERKRTCIFMCEAHACILVRCRVKNFLKNFWIVFLDFVPKRPRSRHSCVYYLGGLWDLVYDAFWHDYYL